MILHLISDDKFIDYTIKHFLQVDNDSDFLLVSDNSFYEIKNIKNKDKVILLNNESKEYKLFISTINKYSAIITHGLFYPWQEKIILSISKNTKIAWVFWGAEIYGRPEFKRIFLAPKTKFLFYKRRIKKFLQGKGFQNEHFFASIKTYRRINYCLTDVHEDFNFVNFFINNSIQEVWYNYYSIEETLGELISKNILGENILVGNSSSIENNHLDIFKILKKIDLGERKIVVPLSYGATWLKNKLIKRGTDLFGTSFLPLLQFMERNDYNHFLISCNVVIMNHHRPQALGNIITTLWLGAKLYMSERNHLYDYLRRIGIEVFSIEKDLTPLNKFVFDSLNLQAIENNRKILMQVYGNEKLNQKILFVKKLLNN